MGPTSSLPSQNLFSKLDQIFFQPRYYPPFFIMGFYLLGSSALRGVLILHFAEPGSLNFSTLSSITLLGLRMDLAAASWYFLPAALWFTLIPSRFFNTKTHRLLLTTVLFLFFPIQLFFFKSDYEFFAEFNARFNTVAVDYLIYPHEVFFNLWESYPIVRIVLGCLWGGGFIFTAIWNLRLDTKEDFVPFRRRMSFLFGYMILGLLATQTISIEKTRFSDQRVLNEISSNGQYSFVYSALTRHLDYPAFYRTIDRDEAFDRARRLVNQQSVAFINKKDSLQRIIQGKPVEKKWNVVILLIESFGSEFWGVLGRPDTLTPEMDALSKEGLLFTNLYASGNRTVRGIEGVLSSFPPLPGDSIVKRHMSDNVSSLARTFKTHDYNTVYLYGGRGVFDGMRSYAVRNGFDRFIEQKDFPNPTFTTIWGVADEDLYRRGVDELRVLYDQKKPFFATFLSVSNHKPYTYPKGRIPENPDQHSRSHAVKYTDWSLGEFFRLAKKEKFYDDTIFVVVADHGARVYGSQSIPIESYKIPMVILGSVVKQPSRVDILGGSLDVGPTILGLTGLTYKSVFFGRDLFSISDEDTWAAMHHNRDVGLYRDGRLVVLGLNKTVEFYEMSSKKKDLIPLHNITEKEKELEKDAIALFQVADELYTTGGFNVD